MLCVLQKVPLQWPSLSNLESGICSDEEWSSAEGRAGWPTIKGVKWLGWVVCCQRRERVISPAAVSPSGLISSLACLVYRKLAGFSQSGGSFTLDIGT